MKKLRTAQEIILTSSPFGRDLLNNSVLIRIIETAQREAIEAATENAKVTYSYLPSKDDVQAEVDKQSILNLLNR